jgi:hypothetical protein
MAIALFSWTDGAWKLLSHAKGLDGVGALGFLNVDRLIVHIAGYQQYFIEIPSGYTSQGITEFFSVFYASYNPNGKPSPLIKELGTITTSSDGCVSGIKDQVHEVGELIVYFKERQYPDLIKGSRKKRIAMGSGTQVQDVNQLLKQFMQMQKMMKQMGGKGGLMKMMRSMGGKLPPGMLPPR